MEMIGLYGGDPRPPLVPLKEADREELQKVLTKTGFFPEGVVWISRRVRQG
jgi:4-hydroxy-2-oxoglutarate aldolase